VLTTEVVTQLCCVRKLVDLQFKVLVAILDADVHEFLTLWSWLYTLLRVMVLLDLIHLVGCRWIILLVTVFGKVDSKKVLATCVVDSLGIPIWLISLIFWVYRRLLLMWFLLGMRFFTTFWIWIVQTWFCVYFFAPYWFLLFLCDFSKKFTKTESRSFGRRVNILFLFCILIIDKICKFHFEILSFF
jgi:hypothetical protein